jgi:hypothetical protein
MSIFYLIVVEVCYLEIYSIFMDTELFFVIDITFYVYI